MWYLIIFVWTQSGVTSQTIQMNTKDSCVIAFNDINKQFNAMSTIGYATACEQK